jgi:hypothetical protein
MEPQRFLVSGTSKSHTLPKELITVDFLAQFFSFGQNCCMEVIYVLEEQICNG